MGHWRQGHESANGSFLLAECLLCYTITSHLGSDAAGGKRVKDFAIDIGHPTDTAVAPAAEAPPLAAPVRVTLAPATADKRVRAVALGLALMAHAAVLYALSREPDVAGRGGQQIDTISVTIVSSNVLEARQSDQSQPNAPAASNAVEATDGIPDQEAEDRRRTARGEEGEGGAAGEETLGGAGPHRRGNFRGAEGNATPAQARGRRAGRRRRRSAQRYAEQDQYQRAGRRERRSSARIRAQRGRGTAQDEAQERWRIRNGAGEVHDNRGRRRRLRRDYQVERQHRNWTTSRSRPCSGPSSKRRRQG